MSRKRNSKRKSMAVVHSLTPCSSMEECEFEYYRPGCYSTPQTMPSVVPCAGAYLHDYVPPWTAACNSATYVVDAYGLVYYLSDFEHQLQFPNACNMVETEITYHIPTYLNEDGCEVATDDEESELISPRKRERVEYEKDIGKTEAYKDVVSGVKYVADKQVNSDEAAHEYYVEEPSDADVESLKA
ncbi:unnamed protein product [Ceratitis capitata]|uniref:(Mediterranean fruit fly) hypothetical protein n=1 Tax=Ceratitis capitata TaxID=7213 RepID=W8AAK3_CERCA|nr:unnamed protein product [Ceratitis capitata]